MASGDATPVPSRPAGHGRSWWHSVSSTREYERCPRRYWFGYVGRVPADRHVPAAWRIGSAVHAALEAAYRHRQQHPDAPLVEGLDDALAALARSWDDLELGPGDDADEAYGRAARIVERALRADVLDVSTVVGVELPLRAELEPGHRVVGFVDLLIARDEATLEIVDHKVTRRRTTPTELAGDLQVNLYGALARSRWPEVTTVRASHHYPTGPEAVTVTLTEAGMESAYERVASTARRAAADPSFEPTPGRHCEHCPWLPRCAAGQAGTDHSPAPGGSTAAGTRTVPAGSGVGARVIATVEIRRDEEA